MVRVLMHGCCGAMGRVITGLAADREDLKIVAGVDRNTDDSLGYPVFQSLEACDVEVDAIIDFTAAPAVDHLLDYCAEKKVPVVLCSTGLSDAQMAKVSESAKKVAVLRSANMSLGINLLMKLVKDAAATLADAGFDIEIVEKHHNRKLDAPSGTALALADSITYDRSARHEKRDPKEIGISAVRGGSIVGEHDVIFAGQDEVVTISHTAYSRAIFGKGALEAAKFLAGRPAGLYNMADVIEAGN